MTWLWVALGGAIGASLRYGLGLLLFKPQFIFPWPTWWINILGCLCAGIFFALSQKFPILQQETRLFLMVGVLGGFTTFSSFGLEIFQLIRLGAVQLAMVYGLSSVLVGCIVLGIGYWCTASILGVSQ